MERVALTLGKRAENARILLNHLYRNPVVTPNEVAGLIDATHQTARTLIRDFERLNILQKSIKIKRNQTFVFKRYLALFDAE